MRDNAQSVTWATGVGMESDVCRLHLRHCHCNWTGRVWWVECYLFLPSNTNRVHSGIGERWENGSSDGCNHLRVLFILLMSSNWKEKRWPFCGCWRCYYWERRVKIRRLVETHLTEEEEEGKKWWRHVAVAQRWIEERRRSVICHGCCFSCSHNKKR